MTLERMHNAKDFNKDVLDRSNNIPVLVHFWANWCEPCRFIEPILENLALEAHGNWKLIKINTDLEKDVSLEWGVKGVPNLKLFYKREIIDEVSGAMSEPDLKKWLENKLPSKAKALTMEAAQLLEIGKSIEGMAMLKMAMNEDIIPDQTKLLLARQKLWKSPEEVFSILEGIKFLESAKEILIVAEAMMLTRKDLEEGAPKDKLLEGLLALKSQDMVKAIKSLIQAISVDRLYHEELPRKLVVALFHHLGETHEITRHYRKEFDRALF